MAKKAGSEMVRAETEAFEMIELAIEDLEVLTRAFEVIEDLCREANNEGEEEIPGELLFH